ncbi:YhdT family protein [Kurthia massiliensis]|uniref:YhdT family protein n=1 Tax=Kurthia massiliensis TaxID=1033739 RepID=UPI0002887B3E|nr:YhdT family protein [Kurthia massiliensis]
MKDKRYRIANREAWIGVGLVILNFTLWYGFAYGMGGGDPQDYTYILGFPAWFFYSCIVTTITMLVLLGILLKVVFKEVPLDDEEEDEK